jgi:hypothetical protein
MSFIQKWMTVRTSEGKASRNPPRDTRRSISRYTLLLAIVILTLLTRLLPVSISSLPYNNDGLTECRIADDILDSGHLDYPAEAFYTGTHSVILPIYNALLAFVSAAVGLSPFDVAQLTTAVIAVLTVLGGYLIALQMTRSVRSALVAALILSLLGTFMFFTGSAWKASLGMALFVLLTYAYMNRGDKRYLIIEVALLMVLPFVHHLATIIAYLAILYLTVWSVFVAFVSNRLAKRHAIDTAMILSAGIGAYLYYSIEDLDRLSLVSSGFGMLYAIIAFIAVCAVTIVVFNMKTHVRYSFAPAVSLLLFGFLSYDYYQSSITYVSSAPPYVLALAAAVAVLAGFAWYGLEKSVEQKSKFRAIPLCLLLPFLTLMGFAVLYGLQFNGQQMIFRSFDFAVLSLAVGIGICVSTLRRTGTRDIVIYAVIIALLVSMPFSYATQELNGVRHDTQLYEVEAFEWLSSASGYGTNVQSDERLSYISNALYDFEKMPWLPRRLVSQEMLGTGVFYVLEDEWMVKGVNNFPNGVPIVSSTWAVKVLEASNVLYLGGPSSNNLVIFETSDAGWQIVISQAIPSLG